MKVPNWSDAEIQYVQDAYAADVPVEVIASQLGRTNSAVYLKASRLGVTDSKRKKRPAEVEAIKVRVREWWATLDRETILHITQHPCTQETKDKISATIKQSYKDGSRVNSEEHRQIASDTLKKLKAANPGGRFSHPGTGSAGKRADLGFYVRSRWEANVARLLWSCLDQGIFQNVEYEPLRFDFDAIKRGVRSYLPDFRITWPDDQIEYVEVKGWWDARSKTAVKRFYKYYPTETLWIIDAPVYKELVNEFAELFPEWER